jgi:nucleotidyltransferase substrate binding protein (TIGR01987 family)
MSSPPTDIRWHQRYTNFTQALTQLQQAGALARQRALSDLERQGLIKAFEFTQELAWNVMKDYFEYQGSGGISGSRDAIREAFRRDLVSDGKAWMETIVSRNRAAHTYIERIAREIVDKVINSYLSLFEAFSARMGTLRDAGG